MKKYLDLNWMLEQQNHMKMIKGSVRRIMRSNPILERDKS
jgi:hypothetical protein